MAERIIVNYGEVVTLIRSQLTKPYGITVKPHIMLEEMEYFEAPHFDWRQVVNHPYKRGEEVVSWER